MESECSESNSAPGLSCTDLPLHSLRLLVPPLQLMSASIWQVFQRRDVTNYATLAEFVRLVTEMVPELLIYRHRAQLILGLQARHILELCRSDCPVDPQVILTHLHKIQPLILDSDDVGDMEVESSGSNFLELVQTLLKDVDQRELFFTDIFPVEFGPQYDLELQTLMWEFLSRLVQLLPTPDLEQTIQWLGSASSVLDDCARVVSHPTDLKCLLQHHKRLGYLDQHVPPSAMGDYILSSLSISPHSRTVLDTEKTTCHQSEPSGEFRENASLVSLGDDLGMEVVTLTEYAEVVLGSSMEVVELSDGNGEGQMAVDQDKKPEEMPTEEVVMATKSAMQDQVGVLESDSELDEAEVDVKSSQQPIPSVAHNCSVCEKSFKFASALIAHQVIHTGERPYVCNLCGRCFSFRQSLDRHKHTHKDGRIYNCLICGETFQSLSARTEHKKIHTEQGAYQCSQCNRTFSWESAMVRHLKSHTQTAEVGPQELTRSFKSEREDVDNQEIVGKVVVETSETDPVLEDEGKSHYSPQEGQGSSEPSLPGLLDEVKSLVQVRTSGRKPKPSLKVQMVNLQKRKEKVTTPKGIGTLITPKCSKSLAFKSEEHSYGFPTVSTEEGDPGLSAGSSTSAFSCPKCSFFVSDPVSVQQHIETVHSGDVLEDSAPQDSEDQPARSQTGQAGLYDCPDCDNSFKFQSLLKYHQRIHTGERPFVCQHCGRRFSFKQSLERHKQTHKDGRKYECPICGQSFQSLSAHAEHTKSHMENGVYRCSECDRTFSWKSALVRHLRIHTENSVSVTERSHKCPRCDLGFGSSTYLSRHLLTHQEERSHVCTCGKAFAYKTALTAHQRTHLKERPHQCKQCGKGFLYKGGLVSHMKIHSDEMPFMCSFCGKSFKRERNMKKHECCHTRENLYSCSQCDKTFVYKATLTRHELTHSGERPFLCADCGKGFFSHAELLKHERFHTGHKPFQCPYCGKKFTQSCYLTIHLRYHTGLRPYSCTYCDKCFLSANRLKRHTRTHTGEKPYLCSECGKGFKQSYHLKMHQRTHATKIC